MGLVLIILLQIIKVDRLAVAGSTGSLVAYDFLFFGWLRTVVDSLVGDLARAVLVIRNPSVPA